MFGYKKVNFSSLTSLHKHYSSSTDIGQRYNSQGEFCVDSTVNFANLKDFATISIVFLT